MRRRAALALSAALLAPILALGGCATPSGSPEPPVASPSSGGALRGELTIYAAASLSTAFDELAAAFESENAAIDIRPIVYDGSSTLARQLQEGAQADVFASADETNMGKVDALLDGSSEIFATNTLVLATPAGNPADVTSLADLADPGVTVVLCEPEVPCGASSQRLLDAAGVTVRPASLEQNVTAVLTKVASGDADAGLVYRTDVIDRADVESIAPEGAADIVNRYPISALTESAEPEAARAFVAFVTGARGQRILADYGFGAP
ncbi:molybdate ABC transporter substrate-binding protein [Microbacterium sp. DT81.1]|uniref:molybdate ABC transporter substrate-binding protein n=1 Tax=Microbacterium sp. DT81.1 TaxID=3393413 RepID=UPI003CEB4B10